MKTCKHCGTEKSLNEMVKHKATTDGYINVCKLCKNEQKQKYLAKVKELIELGLRQKPTRFEPSAGLTASQRRSIGANSYVKREREENEATGWLISKIEGTYKPEEWNLRPGAEDHKQHKSVGL